MGTIMNTATNTVAPPVARTISFSELVDIEIDGIDTHDYPDFCDAYVSGAVWKDTLEPLTDEELDDVDPDEIGEYISENQLYL